MKTLYEILGVDTTASRADIKAAYQRAAQANHPDKGGTAENFQAIQNAFDILYNDDKRDEYDLTGKVSEETDERSGMLASIGKLLIEILDKGHDGDPITQMIQHISAKKGQYQSAITTAQRLIDKRKRVVNKIIKKDGGDNFLVEAINKDIGFLETSIVNAHSGINP